MECGEEEQEIAEGTKKTGEKAEAGPDESSAFDGKGESDGVMFQLHGNRERETSDGEAGVKKARGGGFFRVGLGKK